jgi:hypothetical protein
MIKSTKTSSIKKLSKTEQKAIVGGMCPGGGYPTWCEHLKRRVCPRVCGFDI